MSQKPRGRAPVYCNTQREKLVCRSQLTKPDTKTMLLRHKLKYLMCLVPSAWRVVCSIALQTSAVR